MIKSLSITAILFFIISFCMTAVVKGQQSEKLVSLKPNYGTVIENRLANVEDCGNANLPLYFHGQYITTHSAEALNNAYMMAAACDMNDINIQIFVTTENMDVSKGITKSLKSHVKALGMENTTNFEIIFTEPDTMKLNGHSATVSFKGEAPKV